MFRKIIEKFENYYLYSGLVYGYGLCDSSRFPVQQLDIFDSVPTTD